MQTSFSTYTPVAGRLATHLGRRLIDLYCASHSWRVNRCTQLSQTSGSAGTCRFYDRQRIAATWAHVVVDPGRWDMQECGDFRHSEKCCWIPRRCRKTRWLIIWWRDASILDVLRWK